MLSKSFTLVESTTPIDRNIGRIHLELVHTVPDRELIPNLCQYRHNNLLHITNSILILSHQLKVLYVCIRTYMPIHMNMIYITCNPNQLSKVVEDMVLIIRNVQGQENLYKIMLLLRQQKVLCKLSRFMI